jgi:hypothetical protein
MSILTGYTANLPTDVALNMGVLFRTIAGTSTKIGVTQGPPDFDPGVEMSDVVFDGMRCRLSGLTRKTGFKPIIKGTLIEFAPAAAGKQTLILEPGSGEATATGVTTTTPKSAGIFFATADYVTNLRWIFDRGNGAYTAILFPIALCTKWSMKGVDKAEAQISFEFEAIGDPAVDLGTAPYLIEHRTALPA